MNREVLALALIGLGILTVDKHGAIWRHQDGSTPIAPTRADTGRHRAGSYRKLQFTWGGKRQAVLAHRVVWMVTNRALIPEGLEINHKDGDRENNAPRNLELVIRSENVKHSFRVLGQKVKEQRGVKNTSAKLDEAKVLEIRALRNSVTQRYLAAQFGVTQRTISEIQTRKTWAHVP